MSGFLSQASSGYAIFKFFISWIVSILIIVIGIMLYNNGKKYDNWIRANANIVKSICNGSTPDPKTGRISYSCEMEVKYNNDLIGVLTMSSDRQLSVGETVNIMYDSQNPSDIKLNDNASKDIGKWMIGIGILLFIVSLFGIIYCISGDGCAGIGAVMAVTDTTSSLINQIKSNN